LVEVRARVCAMRAETRLRSAVRSIDTVAAGRHDHGVTLILDTLDGWRLSVGWPAPRRCRYRLGLLLYAVGLRQLAVRVAGVPTQNGPGR
jgi:hypothetical protein